MREMNQGDGPWIPTAVALNTETAIRASKVKGFAMLPNAPPPIISTVKIGHAYLTAS